MPARATRSRANPTRFAAISEVDEGMPLTLLALVVTPNDSAVETVVYESCKETC